MKRSYVIALSLAVVAVLWLATGSFHSGGAAPANAVAVRGDGAPTKMVSVRVVRLQGEDRPREIKLTGRTGPIRTAELRAEVPGRVIAKTLKKGSMVKAGDVIVRLAENDRAHRVVAAQATVKYREIAYDAAKKLSQKAYRSRVKLSEEKAALAEARAVLSAAKAALANMTLRAPFDGVLDQRPVDPGDYLKEGDHAATVVDLDPIVIGVEVAERDIDAVSLDMTGHVRLASGREVSATVDYRARDSRTAARTYRVELTTANPDGEIPSGITAEVTLAVGKVRAHHVTSSTLTLNEDGDIGLKTVDAQDVVRFVKADLIAETPEGLWVGGLPDEVRVIVVGQEYVKSGQKVIAVEAES